MAGEGRKMGEAWEGGEEEVVVGDAGVCIAACKVLASHCPVVDASVDPQTSWRPHCESISLGAFVSASPSPFERLCVSVCRPVSLQRFVHPQQVMLVTLQPPVSVCRRGRLTSGVASLCLSVGLTKRRKAAGKQKKPWKEEVWRSPLQTWE